MIILLLKEFMWRRIPVPHTARQGFGTAGRGVFVLHLAQKPLVLRTMLARAGSGTHRWDQTARLRRWAQPVRGGVEKCRICSK